MSPSSALWSWSSTQRSMPAEAISRSMCPVVHGPLHGRSLAKPCSAADRCPWLATGQPSTSWPTFDELACPDKTATDLPRGAEGVPPMHVSIHEERRSPVPIEVRGPLTGSVSRASCVPTPLLSVVHRGCAAARAPTALGGREARIVAGDDYDATAAGQQEPRPVSACSPAPRTALCPPGPHGPDMHGRGSAFDSRHGLPGFALRAHVATNTAPYRA